MKKDILDSKLKKTLIEIAKKNDLSLLILFGSRVDKTNREDSDWDFAFKKDSNIKFKDLHNDFSELFEKFDLIDLDKEEDILLRKNIAQNSYLIYEKYSSIYDLFIVNSIYEFIDYLPFFKIEEEIVNSKLEKL